MGDRWLTDDLAWLDRQLTIEQDPEPNARPVHPGSVVAIDNRSCVQYDPISSQVASLLHATEDNLHAIKVMIRDAEVMHTYAEYAMVRGALECAALAWWLLAPNDRSERVKRHLRLLWRDTVDMHEAIGGFGDVDERKEKRRQQIIDASAGAGIASGAAFDRWGYQGVIREFSEATGIPALLTWQAASGMVHGRRWAMSALSILEPHGPSDVDKMVEVKVSGDTHQLGLVLRVALLAFKAAERLYARRRTAPGNLAGVVSRMYCPAAIRVALLGFSSLSPPPAPRSTTQSA
ncbi:hypothetical protein [Intrasporangium mesophilum]